MLNAPASRRAWSPRALLPTTWSPAAWAIGLLLAGAVAAAAAGAGPGTWVVCAVVAGVSLSASVCSRNSAAVLLPVGGQRSLRDVGLASSFLLGTMIGALVLVPVALIGQGLSSPIPAAWAFALWAAASGAVLIANVATGSCPLPQMHRQIPQSIVATRMPGGAWRFGAALGTSAMTYMPSCAPYALMFGLILLQPSLVTTVGAAIGFGAGRAIGMLGRSVARDRGRFEDAFQRVVAPLQRGVACVTVMMLLVVWYLSA